jgi:ABC-type uncharacterized transport system substrate-binding protein
MTRRTITVFFMGIFFIAVIAATVWVNLTKPRILVLQSYSLGYVWTKQLDEGLQRVFNKHSGIDIRYHYMATKKKSGKRYLHRAGIAARAAIDRISPDVVIALDDHAQELAAMAYVNQPDINIVFAGINGSAEPYGYHKADNVTGIFERKPANAIKEAILILHGGLKSGGKQARAMFLGDTTLSVKRDTNYLKSYDWAPVDYLGGEFVSDFDSWKKVVNTLAGRTDFLLVGGYRKLTRAKKGGKFVPPEEVMGWTEANSPVPVIGMNVFNSEEGAMLSVGVSPYEQGGVAAEMAIRIIREKISPKTIPTQTSRQYVVSVNNAALKKRGIRIPKVFEAFARATDNYFE